MIGNAAWRAGTVEIMLVATQHSPDRSGGIRVLLAASAGLGVANLYYAQPLAEAVARDFRTTASGVSSALVGTQLGYAAGPYPRPKSPSRIGKFTLIR